MTDTLRVLRSSVWTSYERPPMITVMKETDLADTLENIQWIVEEDLTDHAFFIHEVLTLNNEGDTSIDAVTHAVMENIEMEREQNMAVLFFWSKQTLRIITSEGVLMTDRPAPMSKHDVAYVLRRLAAVPEYESQTVSVTNEDDDLITMVGGDITINGEPA